MTANGLLFKNTLRKDRVRLNCALFGISAAAALLTWTLGLAFTTWWQERALSETMGQPFDCWVATNRAAGAAPKGSGIQNLAHASPVKMIPKVVADAVKTAPEVASCLATTVFRCRLDWRPEGRPLQGPGIGGGIAPVRDFPKCPYPDGLAAGRWPQAEAPFPEFAISPLAFGKEGLRAAPPLGTRFPVVTPGGTIEATLCGYLAETIRPVSGFPTMFASNTLADAAALTETDGLCNLMLLTLKPFHSTAALAEKVRTLAPEDDAARLITRADLLRQLRSDAIQSLSRQVPLLVILACAATFCMLANALCIGIEQNRTQYARLRAIGMTSGQLMRLLCREGLFLAGAGGGAGFALGSGLLALFVNAKPLLFPDGLHLGWQTPLCVSLLLLLATALALCAPLRSLRALSPCELRMVSPSSSAALHHPCRALMLALLALLPIIATPFLFHARPLLRSGYFLLIGLPLTLWGLHRLSRPLLWGCEIAFAVPIGKMIGLRPELLRGCLTRFADRNARMVMMLSTGLGAFFAIHLWGASLTTPFIPSRDLPDAIISLLPEGISSEGTATLAATRIKDVALTPFSAEQYRLHDEDFAAIITRTGATPKQNNLLLLGTPGEQGVTITAMFARQSGLQIGDTFRLQRKDRAGNTFTLPLTITDIRAVNWHLFTARARLRARNGAPMGTLGPVFVSEDCFKQWDPAATSRTRFFWASLPPESASCPDSALYSLSDQLELSLQAFANRDTETHPYYAQPFGRKPKPGQKPSAPPNVTVHLRDEISSGTLARSSELLADLARIPLWSLLILCTGFLSLAAANVRAMRDELRTLHAIGMTAFQLHRFLFAQTLLLCIAAILTALLVAFTIGWGFTGWTLAWMPFGGLPLALTIPWRPFAIGIGVLATVTFLMTPLPILFLVKRLLHTR